MNLPKISVIIPYYNVPESLTKKSIDSVLQQTYPNIEIIIVNDGSENLNIFTEYQKKYNNIKVVEHKTNKGLFQARITGIKACHGDYIAFLDSDDSVSMDFYRKLLRTIQKNDADICIADYVYEYEDGSKKYFPSQELRNIDISYSNKEILDKFISGHGYDFAWQVVWNKLYKRSVIEQALPYLEDFAKTSGHLIMTEDIAYSLSFYLFANKTVNCHNVYYYYYQHAAQSINLTSLDKTKKNFTDVVKVFNYFELMLKRFSLYENYKSDFEIFKKALYNIYYLHFEYFKAITEYEKIARDTAEYDFPDCIFIGEKEQLVEFDKAYADFESIIKEILSEKTKIVSFDVFDTLLKRTTYFPTDVFVLLGEKFKHELSSGFFCNFADIRCNAEYQKRQESKTDEITLDEIYDYMASTYGIDKSLADKLKNAELEIEKDVLTMRETGKDFYDIAQINGKEIIYISDMYLPENFIYSVLQNNGYSKENKLYLSCEYRQNKWQGNLYKTMLLDKKISPKQVVHIGDNHFADFEKPSALGIRAFYFPSVREIFESNLLNRLINKDTTYINFKEKQYIGIRQMYATVANKLFDFPFIDNFSEFRCSTKGLGYYALGMELFAVVNWIIENTQNRGRIHFVARDGYLPQRAYEIIKKELNLNLPESNYLYSSRKFLYPLSMENKMDLFTTPQHINIYTHNIEKLISYFPEECINRDEYSKIPTSDRKRKFENFNNFYDHINQIASLINFDKLNEYRDEVKNYLSAIIRDNDIIFDIGYNGRTEAILSRLLGFSVNSLILHHYNDAIYQNKNKLGFCNKCFFDHKPKVTGELREMLLMKTDRSFLRFDFKKNGVVENVFCSTVDFNDSNVSIINAIQNNALQFIIDLLKNNGNYLNILQMYSKDVACLPLENYLMRPESIDQLIWKSFDFEDDIGQGIINVIQSWNRQLEYNNLLFVNQTANNVKLSWKKRFINKLFPYGTKRRKRAVKFVNTLLPKGTKRRQFVKKLLRWK